MKSTDLRGHITATYFNLRIGMAALAIILPLVLWIGGIYFAGLSLEPSMSDYYHAGGGAMRDVFVGGLIAVGAFLYLYKGFTSLENIALNLAGIFLRIPVKATGESSRRRPPNPVEGDQVRDEPLDARLMFIGNVAHRLFSIKAVA